MLLVFVGLYQAIHWWQVVNDFGPVVEKAGGTYYRHEPYPVLPSIFLKLTGTQTTSHIIRFAPGQVDDAWMQQHAERIRTSSNLQLVLRGTQLTDAGFQSLQGCRNLDCLDLRRSRLRAASAKILDTMPSLQSLDIAYTDMMASDLSPLCLGRLNYLGIEARQIDDAGIEVLKSVFGKKGKPFLDFSLYDADKASLERLLELNLGFSLRLTGKPVSSECIPLLVQLMQSNGIRQLALDDSTFTREETLSLRNAIGGCLLQQMSQDQYDRLEEAFRPQASRRLW